MFCGLKLMPALEKHEKFLKSRILIYTLWKNERRKGLVLLIFEDEKLRLISWFNLKIIFWKSDGSGKYGGARVLAISKKGRFYIRRIFISGDLTNII